MLADYPGLRAIWAVERRFCPMNRSLLWPRASRDTGRAMSLENVEVVRAAMEAFNRRDGEGFGALLAGDVEIVPVRAALEGTTYSGPDAAPQYCAAVDQTWEHLRW